MPIVRKPARAIAKRTFAKASRQARLASSARQAKYRKQFRESLRSRIRRNLDRLEKREILAKANIPVECAGVRLRPETQAELEEIMEALQYDAIPERLQGFSGIKKLNFGERRALILLLQKYYNQYLTGKILLRGTEWNTLKRYMEKIKRTGAAKDQKARINYATRMQRTAHRRAVKEDEKRRHKLAA